MKCEPPPPSDPQAQPAVVISVGGFYPSTTSPSFASWFPLPETLPVLHVVGKNDTLITEERTQGLVTQCRNSRVEVHEGGHFTPSKASWRHFFKQVAVLLVDNADRISAYLTSFAEGGSQGDVPSPSAFGPSGANTPSKSGAQTPRAGSPPPS